MGVFGKCLVVGELYLDLFTFPISLFRVFVLERGGLSDAGSWLRDLDRERRLVRTGMVSIDILEFRVSCFVGIVPEVSFLT